MVAYISHIAFALGIVAGRSGLVFKADGNLRTDWAQRLVRPSMDIAITITITIVTRL